MNGPYEAGLNNKTVFLEKGLKAKLVKSNIKAIGDMGYLGQPELISCPNVTDSDHVQGFKSRALKRHEKFNGMIKNFESFKQRF